MKTRRRCTRCDETFEGEHWQRYCWSCWRDRKNAQEHRLDYERGWDAGYAVGIQRQASQLDSSLLRDVIALCHPDRHPAERYALANAVTAQLLELRGELAA